MSQPQTEPATATTAGRPPCELCGESMTGEHHNSRAHKVCREKGKSEGRTTTQGASTSVEAVVETPTGGAVKVRVREFPQPDPVGDMNEYWVGTLPGCPIQNVTAGGICFPLYTGRATFDDRCRIMEGNVARGATITLTDIQVKDIIASIERKALRFHGKAKLRYIPRLAAGDGPKDDEGNLIPNTVTRAQATMISVDGGQARAGDIPLAKYLYMIPTKSVDFHGRDKEPDPMLEE